MSLFVDRSNTRRSIVALACTALLLVGTARAQEGFITLPDGERISLDGGPVSYVHDAQTGTTAVERYDPNEVKSVIVQLRSRPTALAPAGVLQQRGDVYGEHAAFRAALREMQLRLGKNAAGASAAVVTHEYFRTFNGVAIRGPAAVVDRLRHLPMVRSVRPDFEVEALLDGSVAQVGADRVHEELGLTGNGVRVCIVDTGIDYDHPALGGGFGPGFRVVGGYDFANDDADPMDGHGHGTHVAGIVGARSDSLLGVAPGVTFLAAKVLSDEGGGTASSIIAGIEYCVDPDGDPATDDGAAIINMSLGGPPTPDSPIDEAVANAAAAGVLSVVAAGNSGRDSPSRSGYGTIGSPATAARALSVGAVDAANTIAYFSSKGPGLFDDAVKPEIVAPGVEIRSSVTGGETERHSGTSMAAPHVAGAAALLKERHPEWTADELKWRLVNAARPAPEGEASPYVYGNGVLDVWSAGRAEVTVSPGVLSFGAVDLEEPVWRDTLRFTVANHADEPRHVRLDRPGGLPGGATLTLSAVDFVLASREERTVTAVLAVDGSVPVVGEAPFAYSDVVRLTTERDSVRLPMGFVKAHTLALELEAPAWFVLVYDPQAARHYASDLGTSAQTQRLRVAAGRYDILTVMREATPEALGYYVVQKRGVEVEGLTVVEVEREDARLPLFPDDILGGDGQPPETYLKSVGVDVQWFSEGGGYISYGLGFSAGQEPPVRMWSSPLDERYDLTRRLLGVRGDRVTALGDIHRGGLGDAAELHLPSGPENLTDVYADFVPRHDDGFDRQSAVLAQTHSYTPTSYSMGSMGFLLDSLRAATVSLGASGTVRDEQDGLLEYVAYAFGAIETTEKVGETRRRIEETSSFEVTADGQLEAHTYLLTPGQGHLRGSRIVYHPYQPRDTVVVRPWYQDVLLPIYHMEYRRYDTGSAVVLDTDHLRVVGGVVTPSGQRLSLPPSWLPEHEWPQVQARLYNRNRVQEAAVSDHFFATPVFEDIFGDGHRQSGLVRVVGETLPYTLLGQSGHTVLDAELHIGASSRPQSPSLEVLQVLADGRLVEWVRPGQDAALRLVVQDQDNTLADVETELLLHDGEVRELDARAVAEGEYVAELPQDLPHAFVDVRVRVRTDEGHRFELTATPAFFFGTALDEWHVDSRVYLRSYELTNRAAVADGLLEYELTLANTGNVTARDVEIHVPETEPFGPAEATIVTVDSLAAGAETVVPLSVRVRERLTEPTYFAPTFTWSSGPRGYARDYRMLVDSEGVGTAIDDEASSLSEPLVLHPNYPNPFEGATTFTFDIGQPADVRLAVYDVLGRRIAMLVDERRSAGRHTVQWEGGTQLAAGVYFVRIEAGEHVAQQPVLVVR